MFSSKERLRKRTGEFGVGRCDYLEQLAREFQQSDSREAKRQVLANLANFAYDPINYHFLRLHRVIDLFLDTLSEDDEPLCEFAVGGICNLCVDPVNQEYILQHDGIKRLEPLLKSQNQEIVCNTITTLIYLKTPSSLIDLQSLQIMALLRFRPIPAFRSFCSAVQIGQKGLLTREVTQADVEIFSEVSGDLNPVHREGGVVHGAFLNSLVSCVMGTQVPGPGCMVHSQSLRYPNPCPVGHIVEVSVVVTGAKMDLVKCRYSVMARPKDAPLSETVLVLSGEANLIMAQDQQKRVKRKKRKTPHLTEL
ncbi:uncharacterized protein LOC132203304 [Neocloeon triangulifer]|uniref:uncharacterized protein LOC132203304 n=1 Tax=Neocloeon triangulifer TaxID=2078957 RepID=UPI00286EB7B0|nr:uncharacterized protein LOC132203304 [Neocloeon triangulifer]